MKKKNSFSLNNLTSAQKASLLKSAGVLALIIVVFTLLSKTLLSGNESLAEYAQKNPDLAYNNTSDVGIEDDRSNTPVPESSPATNVLPESTEPVEYISPDRVTYKIDFYYEPLAEDTKNFITGVSYPADGAVEVSYEDLVYVHVLHYDFNGEIANGELICNKAIAQDLLEIFFDLYAAEYQIEKIRLIDYYDGDDTASMLANNTSCFNYRTVDDTASLSKHALGLAIDINPFYNPYVRFTDEGTIISPEGSEAYADRASNFPYKIDSSDLCYQLFTKHGFIWGGNWNSCKDYQHFQKTIE